MIISCYPGIGKTTVAKKRVDIVDLDSSLFKDLGDMTDFDRYFTVAKALSDQGYIVLVSSHDEMRKRLIKLVDSGEQAGEIFPDKCLKDVMIERLRMRYEQTRDDKDSRAYFHARMNFDEDYKLRNEVPGGLIQIFLMRMTYDLEESIEQIIYHANYLEKKENPTRTNDDT